MNIQRISALVKKELLRIIREPANLFLVFLFPVVLTLAFGAAFGAMGSSGETTYSIGVVNHDSTPWSTAFIGNISMSGVLVPMEFDNNVSVYNSLKEGEISGLLIIPSSFGESINSFYSNPTNPELWSITTLELAVDQGSLIAGSVVPPFIQQALTSTMYGEQALNQPSPIMVGTPSLVEASKLTQFDYMVPGLFGYAAIFLSMIVAQTFTYEREEGILSRIAVTPTTSGDIFTSQIVSNMMVGVIQVMVIYASSSLMGFKTQGGTIGILVAMITVLLLVLCNVGFGLITATIAKSSSSATGISFIMILPQMFLGTFVPAPESIARLVPTYYVSQSLTSIFLRGADPLGTTILTNVGIVAVYSLTVIIAGIALYSRYGKR
jgi:ABC-2 type transport system permease protein